MNYVKKHSNRNRVKNTKKTYKDTVQLPGRVLDAQKTHGTEIQGPELFLNSILLQTNTVRTRNTRARAVPKFYSITD